MGCLLALLGVGTAMGAAEAGPAATGAGSFQTLTAITLDEAPWSAVLVPEEGPPRDGAPTQALRWPVAERPGPDSPVLLTDWSGVDAVRFWLHLDKPCPFRLNVLLTGEMNGYFMTSIPLDFTGWRQFTLPIESFGKVREADLTAARRLSFRAQGYGQPEIEKTTVWWVDHVEARPKPGVKLPIAPIGPVAARAAWEALAREGNPYLILNARRYQAELPPFRPPAEIRSAWQYRGVAEQLVPLAYAVADPESPHRGRKDLLEHALGLVDWLTAQCRDEGWWWRQGPLPGDPNVNRFTLSPLLDGIRWLRLLPEGEAAWPRWRDTLAKAIDLQRRAYRHEEAWDWAGLAGGLYANQDLYYVLIMALSAELYQRPEDLEEAKAMLDKVAESQLPDGGFRYIGQENEAPVYHALNVIILGRYAKLTGDPLALKLLKQTANYWPLVLTAEAQPEYWSDVWWKQTWGYVWREALVTAAGATSDARVQWLMWRALERATPVDGGVAGIYCAPWWTGTAPGQAMPERFVTRDRNMRGIRGRAGQWYFGVTQGRGLRNTFTGGLLTSPVAPQPLLAAFRGAQIHVLEDETRYTSRWLSEREDRTALALRPDVAGALGARYTLQPGLINGVPTPKTPPSPWQVTQVWRAAGDGIVGMVILEATQDARAAAVAGRIALGRSRVREVEPGVWGCGPLRVKLLRQFGTVSAQPVPGYNMARERGWPGVEMLQRIPGGAKRGDRFVYAIWVGSESATPPDSLDPLPGDAGWVARWADGRSVAALFNPDAQPRVARVPWTGPAPTAWIGETPETRKLDLAGGIASIQLPPGACALVER